MINRLSFRCLMLLVGVAPDAGAQWVTSHEQFYLPASHNWRFRRHYPGADRLFNAFDYGHAVLYETLWRSPNASAARLEQDEYAFITRNLLNRPPALPLEEAAIEPTYARLVPEAKLMFEWAHVLHRQLYDVLSDERLSPTARDAEVARLVAYYRSRPDIAFSTRPKSMELMEGQRYSLAFRRKYPKFNGLIWAYHWLQVGLYEPLLAGRTEDEQQTGVAAAVARFRQMLESPPSRMPRVMPMTAAVAPTFARRYPEAAMIFDNLHGMHDVISDVLASPLVPRERKRAEILLAARRYRDDSSFVMTGQAWREMAVSMGVENQGGVAAGFLTSVPEGTVPRGAPAEHQHGQTPTPAPAAAPSGHEGHMRSDTAMSPHLQTMMQLQERLLADSIIRRRLAADTAALGLMQELADSLPPEHREHMRQLIREAARARPALAPARSQPATRRATTRASSRPRTPTTPRATTRPPPPARRPAPKPAPKPKPADPHAGHRP